MEHEICFFNSTAHNNEQERQEPIDPSPQKKMKWKKREDFFARKKKKSERNRRGQGRTGEPELEGLDA
jgi:hypothetical protein